LDIKKIFAFAKNEFIYGGHLFAFAASGVILSTGIIGKFEVDPVFLILIYFIYYLIYLYDHSSGADADAMTNPIRAEYLKGKIEKEKYVFAISFLVIAAILFYKNSTFITVASILTLALGMLYGKFFKNITVRLVAFKNFFVAAFWGIIVLYAALCHGATLGYSIFSFSIFVFVKMLAIQAFFDIRDTEGDRLKKLLTFSVVYGPEKTIKIIRFLAILSCAIILGAVYAGYWKTSFVLLILSSVYSMVYIGKYYNKNSYCYLWAAGELLVWTFLILLANL